MTNLRLCSRCGKALDLEAVFCSRCGDPVTTEELQAAQELQVFDEEVPHDEEVSLSQRTSVREIGSLLFLGILLMPYIFSWVTLRKGYDKATRIMSLGWMAFFLVVVLPQSRTANNLSTPAQLAETVRVNNKDKQEQAPDEKPQRASIALLNQAIKRGETLFTSLTKKYPEMRPLLYGALSQKPVLAVAIPAHEWEKLSKADQINLTFYMESLIPLVRTTPDKYIDINKNSAAYSIAVVKMANLGNDDWAILTGDLLENKKSAQYGKTVVQGDTPWNKEHGDFRGMKASEFRQESKIEPIRSEGHSATSTNTPLQTNLTEARLTAFNNLQKTSTQKEVHAGASQIGNILILYVNDRWHLLSRDMKEVYTRESLQGFLMTGGLLNIQENTGYSIQVIHNQSGWVLATWDSLRGFKLNE